MKRRSKRGADTQRGRLALALCAALCLPAGAVAAADPLEYQVKAAVLYNFARFTTWPPSKLAHNTDAIVFCALEREPLSDVLESAVQGKMINTHALLFRRVQRLEEFRNCHVAYLDALEPERLLRALDALAGSGVLSVYESDATLRSGTIRLFFEESHVRFEINTAVTEREHLELSSKLLGVARMVRE